jgi:hypothetical protein
MTDMPFRRPKLQQQFVPRTTTSSVDCAATVGAMMGDAHSRGEYVYDHSQIRAFTNERRPDPGSPGLTIRQVANSLHRLTVGAVELEVFPVSSSWDAAVERIMAGAWAMVATWRGVMVDAGWGGNSPFRGGHGVIYGYDHKALAFIYGDPLVPRWMLDVPPDLVGRSSRQFLLRVGVGAGADGAYYGLTRDVYTPPAGTATGEETMFNVGPVNTHRDAVLKSGAVLYRDSGLVTRHSSVSKETPLGFLGSGETFHVVVNAGNTNYVKRSDVVRIENNEREFE